MSWERFGADEMLERYGQTSFGLEPSIRDNGDVIVRGNGFGYRYSDSHVVLVLSKPLAEDKRVVIQDILAIHIFNDDPEGLTRPMDISIPLKIRRDGDVYFQKRSSKGKDVRLKVESREFVDEALDELTRFW